MSTTYEIEKAKNLLEAPFVVEKRHFFPYFFAKQKLLLPIEERDGVILVAMANPDDLDALQEAKVVIGEEMQEVLAERGALEEAIERCYHQKDEATSELLSNLENKEMPTAILERDEVDLLHQSSESPVIRMLNMMLIEAIQQGASDIHFEPTEMGLSVRYRIDGVLQKRHAPQKEYQSPLTTRLKVMAALDIAEHRLPQDGRIKLKVGGREIDFRVSTVPVVYGERIVLRILDKGNVLLGLDSIGMDADLLKTFTKLIHLSEGIVLVTGPTGSGKTTTLYSALSEINSSDINIMTIEDPVEYKLPSMAQIGVNPKIQLNFARGLRSILRQDPDVIMIGEIRDRETAEIAIQASLTGHLVLSTLHTNDAPSALTRLVDMGIEPYLLTSSVVGVLAQRLVRRICDRCKIGYVPTDNELLEVNLKRENLIDGKLYRGEGCPSCFEYGYKGRYGIYELMPMTTKIKQQLIRSADASLLQEVALKGGLKTLRHQGARLLLEGITTTSEVLRVTRSVGE